MTEKLLPYDRSIVSQERPWSCGPATVQVLLDTRGVKKSEMDLLAEVEALEGNVGRDDQDGTDHVSQVATVLNKYIGGSYQVVEIPNDPPTQAQIDSFWDRLVRSVNAGFGIAGNIIAPPSNYPRPVPPSTIRLNYGGGTVFHYLSFVGYSDVGQRKVWWADSGFPPFGCWVSLEQTVSLIAGKGYAWPAQAASAPTTPPPPPPAPSRPSIDAQALSEAMGCSLARAQEMLPGYIEAMKAADITNVNRAAMFAAQIGHESAGLVYMEEIADGSQYEGRTDLGNTQPGDGRRFKGSGPIQLTGRHNFTLFSQWCFRNGYVNNPDELVNRPERVRNEPKLGFLAASWYWTVARPNINAMCDAGDLDGVTRAINGGLNGIDDRRTRWNRCRAMGDRLLPGNGGFLMALSDAEQQRINFELTHKFRSLFVDPKTGEQSQFEDTLVGYVLQNDRKVEALTRDIDYLTKLVEALAVKAGA